jgi:ATP-dependent Lon protease
LNYQFEQNRLDGKKLCWNEVPTIFDVPHAPQLVSDKRNRRAENVLPDNTTGHDHIIYVKKHYSEETESDASCLVENPVDHIYNKKASISKTECQQDMKDVGEVAEQSAVEEHQRAGTGEESVETVDTNSKNSIAVAKLKKRIKQLEQKLRMVQKLYDQMTTSFKKFLNDDQIRWLKLPMKSKRTVRWSNSTVKRCLQQIYVMGAKGYNHLFKLGYPVPAYGTL